MDMMTRVALATDTEVTHALQVMLKGLTEAHPEIGKLISAPDQARAALAGELPEVLQAEKDAGAGEARATRTILVQLAGDPATAARVGAALDARKTLLEPVTTALVLAGIILLLSTEITIEHTNIDGKKTTKVKVVKKATSDGILKKFFAFFHA